MFTSRQQFYYSETSINNAGAPFLGLATLHDHNGITTRTIISKEHV